MKKETFYRLCYCKNRGGEMVAIKEQGYVRSFKTSDGNEIKLALEKNDTSFVRITEITTGISANTYETHNYTTYKSIIDYINNNQDYIDVTYRLVQEKFQDQVKILADLVERGIIDEGKNYK